MPLFWSIVIFLAFHASCQNLHDVKAEATVAESLAKPTQNSTADDNTKILEKICDLCACKDTILDCTNRSVIKHFNEYEWPANLTLALFVNSSIENVTQFPAITIKKLAIRENPIKHIVQAAFKQIKFLGELDLSKNGITSDVLQPDVFEGSYSPEDVDPLSDLKALYLNDNLLSNLNPDVFEHVTEIRKLSIRNNPLGNLMGRNGETLTWTRNLKELDLSNCNLKELHHNLDYILRDLKLLDLSNNLFESPPLALEAASNLETLIMDGNPFTVVDKTNAFRTMLKLTTLSLNNMTHLTKIEAGSLSNLPSLKNVSLTNCPHLFYISGDSFVNHNNTRAYIPLLKILDLSNNSLQYLPMEMVLWDKLEELHLSNNHWICDCDNEKLIKTFLPKYAHGLLKSELHSLICANPPEFRDRKLISLEHTTLRCLNFFEAEQRNVREAAFLVGILIGLLIAIPIILAIIVFWRKGYFVCGNKPASYSRAFYKRTYNDDNH